MKCIVALLLSSIAVGSTIDSQASTNVAELFVSSENLQLVQQADRVDACILRHIPPAARPDGSIVRSTERYEETTFAPAPAEMATALRDLVLNDQTYDWKAGGGGRRPQFYLRLRFHRGAAIIAVDFCFLCHVLSATRQGEELGHANFGRNGDLFLLAFLKLFPDDAPLKQVAQEAGVIP